MKREAWRPVTRGLAIPLILTRYQKTHARLLFLAGRSWGIGPSELS